MFSQKFSPTTGKMEWVVEDDDYDMRDEIARSAYADMLHDEERNKKYYSATVDAIKMMKTTGSPVNMLDIGTGTGLLAMMAVTSGADTVTACEAFPPIATAAHGIVKKNGFGEQIKVVSKRSTDVSVGQGCDMECRANLLVTELWDTELIGEGALPSLRDACNRLLQPGFVCVPAAGTIYAQVFSCKALWDMHQLDPDQIFAEPNFKLPDGMTKCAGTASAFDLHVDELRSDEIQFLSHPIPVVRFDFCENSLPGSCPNIVSLPGTKDAPENSTAQYHAATMATLTGVTHGVVMWWSLDMDVSGKITLETAPKWAHPDGKNCQWRDHWMQAVYYLKQPLQIKKDQELKIVCCHDDYSIWFDVQSSVKSMPVVAVDRPLCTCGSHVTWSRHRYCMLNDKKRNSVYRTALKELVATGNTRGLCIGDGSLLPLLAAKAGFDKVISLETSSPFIKIIQKILSLNSLNDRVEILDKELEKLNKDDLLNGEINVIMGEPFFSSSLFPWHSLYFWYAVASVRKLLSTDVKIMPKGATLRGMAVEFKDLWKFHAPVGKIEGFDISIFDELIEGSKLTNEVIDGNYANCVALEPHHVWEYPCRPITAPFDVTHFDFTQPIPKDKRRIEATVPITGSGSCQCVVLWMDYHVTDSLTVTTGFTKSPGVDGPLDWVRHTKQGVYFIRSPVTVDATSDPMLAYTAVFDPSLGDITFNFDVWE